MSARRVILFTYLLALSLPIYWLVNMSFKTNAEITAGVSLWPHAPTLANYARIFTDPSWYSGYINSLTYVAINTVLSLGCALPAAYAFSRYRFMGDKHLFFWLPIAAIMTRTISAAGMDWGLLAAAGVLTLLPGALVIWFVRNHIAKGFALGRV